MMGASFFFYDLETSGFDPRNARIMQFAGQRTDMGLQPVEEPVDVLIRLTPDVLPDPDAVLVTGITPQATVAGGVAEAAFLKLFCETVALPDTIFVGYNSVRFDDEFMRYLHYRNFYDAYRWQWCDGCSRWDMLDVVRMTRALRPDGINWPYASDGKPSNRLGLLTSLNGLDHENAHDAGSDVQATIALARLIRGKQPKLFQFLLDMRDKKNVSALVGSGQPFVYTSGAYPAEYEKTTVAMAVAGTDDGQSVLVYDLRHDPGMLAGLTAKELADRLRWRPKGVGRKPMPVKRLRFNRCPAVAPLSVLEDASQKRLGINMAVVEKHRHKLEAMPALVENLAAAYAMLGKGRPQTEPMGNGQTVDGQLYDGFINDADRRKLDALRSAPPGGLNSFTGQFSDNRLSALLPLYKARNYPDALTAEERTAWEKYCTGRLLGGGAKSRVAWYFGRIQALASAPGVTVEQQYLLEELRLYGESVVPEEALA